MTLIARDVTAKSCVTVQAYLKKRRFVRTAAQEWTVSRMISTVIEALCVGIMCAVCYRIGWNKGTDEARHVIMMMLQRGEQNDD